MFWFAAAASLSLTAFVHKAWRSMAGPPGTLHMSVFWLVACVLYAVATTRAARRLGRVPTEDTKAEIYRLAGIGFVLVYFALEMP